MRFPDDVPTLSDGDVTLRAHRPDDAPGIVEQCVDPASARWTTVPLGYTLDHARDFLGSAVPNGWESEAATSFAIEATHPDGVRRFSGTVSLRNEGDRRAEIAFGAHPAVRGRGVMTTAVNLLLDWGFKHRDIETVIWLANRGNTASRRVAWKTGFTFGGTLRRWLNHRDEYPDAWVATLHRDDTREPKTQWIDASVMTGARVRLRPFDEKDVDRISQAYSDALTHHFISFVPHPYTIEHAQNLLVANVEKASTGGGLIWAIADPTTDRLLGGVGLPSLGSRDAEVGYWAHPEARGRGVVSEAVGLITAHAFGPTDAGGLALQRLHLSTAASNTASRRVAEKNGFVESGRERQAELLGDGTLDDRLHLDLLRSEWEGRS